MGEKLKENIQFIYIIVVVEVIFDANVHMVIAAPINMFIHEHTHMFVHAHCFHTHTTWCQLLCLAPSSLSCFASSFPSSACMLTFLHLQVLHDITDAAFMRHSGAL